MLDWFWLCFDIFDCAQLGKAMWDAAKDIFVPRASSAFEVDESTRLEAGAIGGYVGYVAVPRKRCLNHALPRNSY